MRAYMVRALTGIVYLLITVRSASACMCMSLAPPDVKTVRDIAIWETKKGNGILAVFEGKVEKQEVQEGGLSPLSTILSISPGGTHRIVTFAVSRAYRGKAQGQVVLSTGLGGGDCGYDFDTGAEYLVYAYNVEGGLYTDSCTATRPVEEAGAAIRYLRGEPPTVDDLLDEEEYGRKVLSQRTGKVCGRVAMANGRPLAGGMVHMSEEREPGLPLKMASDPNLSKPDGSFCVTGISPGRYLLTAEDYDFDRGIRWMGFYPTATSHAEATPIEVKAGDKLTGLRFAVRKQNLVRVHLRVVTSNGTPIPWQSLGVAIESVDHDSLAYHGGHELDQNGSYDPGLVPPGHYWVRSYLRWGEAPGESFKWQMAKKAVDINKDTEVVLELKPKQRD
jgi:hypothetical protein